MDAFVDGVIRAFGLDPEAASPVRPMEGSANRLWSFGPRPACVVVKELAHDAPHDLRRRRRAAAFEAAEFDAGEVLLPEPLRTLDGEHVVVLEGSRGAATAVRAHRFVMGTVPAAGERSRAAAAGRSYREIAAAGRAWSVVARGSLRRWDVEPLDVVDRLGGEPRWAGAGALLAEALALIDEGERLPGPWTFGHGDHKPENCLVTNAGLAVLDWDECDHRHPRLEVTEAALRWAGPDDPDESCFRSFLAAAGGADGSLEPRDFAGWLAALVGWFGYQARRSLGEWPTDTAGERSAAGDVAAMTLMRLRATLIGLPTWCRWG